MPAQALQQMFSGEKHWAAHAAGAFPALAKHKKITRKTPGANIACYSDIPENSGEDTLGASSAIACATLFGIAAAHHLILEPLEIALLAHRLEGQTAGAPGGYAAPFTAVFGKKDSLLLMKGQPHEFIGTVAPPLGFVVAGLHVTSPESGGNSPNSAQRLNVSAGIAQAMISRAYRDFGLRKDPTGGYLANLSPAMFERYFQHLLPAKITGEAVSDHLSGELPKPLQMGAGEIYFPRAVAAWAIGEAQRAQRFADLLRASESLSPPEARRQAVAAGAIMLESHAAEGNLLREMGEEAAAARLDLQMKMIMETGPENPESILGLRSAGEPGADGTLAILFPDSQAARARLQAAVDAVRARTGAAAEILTGSSSGAAETTALRLDVSELKKK